MMNKNLKMICFDEIEWVWFDCDGTWIDLYGVNGWLDMLVNEDETPYAIAKPLVNLSYMARLIHILQNKGIKVGIISWLSKNGTEEYNQRVTETKKAYFKKHMPSVEFDEIHIVPYGTPKHTLGTGILFDDEKKNRDDWNGVAFDVEDMLNTLHTLTKILGRVD